MITKSEKKNDQMYKNGLREAQGLSRLGMNCLNSPPCCFKVDRNRNVSIMSVIAVYRVNGTVLLLLEQMFRIIPIAT